MRVLLLGICLLLAACVRAGFNESPLRGEQQPAQDGPPELSDAPPVDRMLVDGTVGDVVADAADAAVDIAVDVAVDGAGDAAGDALPPDAPHATDVGGAGELIPILGCNSAVAEVEEIVTSEMVICRAATGYDQCNAGLLCAAGWQICPSSVYQQQIGPIPLAEAPSTTGAWIGGCVRSGSGPCGPTETPCASCGSDTGTSVGLSLPCDPPMLSPYFIQLRVGLVTASTCNEVGALGLPTRGYWAPRPADQLLQFVVCCDAP